MTKNPMANPDVSSGRALRPAFIATAVMVGTAWLAACSSGTTSNAPSTALLPAPSTGDRGASSSQTPGVVETNPPGDIPDSQTFVRFDTGSFSLTVPEGWAQRRSGGATVFSDKYNSVTLTQFSRPNAPTPATARANDVPAIATSTPGYVAGSVRAVARRGGGRAVLITYRARSAPNPVTGKYVITEVERYEFWRKGREAVVTLAAPVGADNVDPWRTVTDSFRWGTR